MGWMETCAVDERMRFVIAAEKHEEAFAAVCRRFGVSRRVGYKWLARYQEAGVLGLLDRSRAPLHHPQAIADELAERCLAVRRTHPSLSNSRATSSFAKSRSAIPAPRRRWTESASGYAAEAQ